MSMYGKNQVIQKTKIMATGPITSWQVDWEKVETVSDFIFLGSKITVDGDCSHEIKRLAPWKKSYNKPRQHIEKQKPKKKKCHFADKGLYSQNYGFSSNQVMDVKVGHKEDQRIDTFKLWCWRRLESLGQQGDHMS